MEVNRIILYDQLFQKKTENKWKRKWGEPQLKTVASVESSFRAVSVSATRETRLRKKFWADH